MLKDKFPYVEEVKAGQGDSWFVVPVDKIVEVCSVLRNEHGFDCLSCLTGTDRGEFVEVVYHLFSYERKETVVLKVRIPPNPPLQKGGTISDIWPSADWMEREAAELLGIKFEGHPNLKNLLLPEDWVGYPLRKDYKEKEEYWGMSTKR